MNSEILLSYITIRPPTSEDQNAFVSAMQRSQLLHHPWVTSPKTAEEFIQYVKRSQTSNNKSFLACDSRENIIGVFNISEIVHGFFRVLI
jgi:hypothetical protein